MSSSGKGDAIFAQLSDATVFRAVKTSLFYKSAKCTNCTARLAEPPSSVDPADLLCTLTVCFLMVLRRRQRVELKAALALSETSMAKGVPACFLRSKLL